MIARASCPSSLASHCAWLPRPGRNAVRHHFKNSADRVSRAKHLIDFLLHARLGLRIDAAQRRIQVGANRLDLAPGRVALQLHVPHGDDVAQYLAAEFAKQKFCQSAGRHARRSLARRGAFQNVARVVKVKFQASGEIGVARARRRQRPALVAVLGAVFDRHRAFPVGPIAILDPQRDGRADGLPVPYAG